MAISFVAVTFGHDNMSREILSQDFWHLPCDIFSARDSIILKKKFKSKNCLNPKNYNFTINCTNDSIIIDLEIDSPNPVIKVIILYYFFKLTKLIF